MLVDDILSTITPIDSGAIYTIKTECSQFLNESAGLPVFRALPKTYDDFQRVKVRYQRRHDSVSEAFNTAFKNETHNIIPRGIFTQSVMMRHNIETEPFYVFPIDGYKYIYSKGVQNSNMNFRHVFETLDKNVDDAFDITTDLIKYTYTKKNLVEGIISESEIIFYNIPHFYVVRVSAINNYNKLINR